MISDEKLSKKEHILKTSDFRSSYKKGSSCRVGDAILYHLPNKLDYSRLGFSISSRSIKKAVTRNKIRRFFREAYRKRKRHIVKGMDLVIVIRRELSIKYCYNDMLEIFDRLIKRSGLGC